MSINLIKNNVIPSSAPLVSIIVPMYNHVRYIENALESFASEGYPNLEVIILDDGSKDDSFSVAETWVKNHPNTFKNIVLERQTNQGITKTLNTLVKLSSGSYITMVASDDKLLPGGIQDRIAALNNRPDWLSVFGNCIIVDSENVIKATNGLKKLGNSNYQALLNDHLRAKELILRWSVPGPVLYDTELFFEDRDFYLRLLAKNALGFINIPVAAYRLHGENTILDKRRIAQVYQTILKSEEKNLSQFQGIEQKSLKFILQISRNNMIRCSQSIFPAFIATLKLLSLIPYLGLLTHFFDVTVSRTSKS
jgi:glycosyltransferase involved in cell wall biosynthesis